jgi:hypothetical protein
VLALTGWQTSKLAIVEAIEKMAPDLQGITTEGIIDLPVMP